MDSYIGELLPVIKDAPLHYRRQFYESGVVEKILPNTLLATEGIYNMYLSVVVSGQLEIYRRVAIDHKTAATHFRSDNKYDSLH